MESGQFRKQIPKIAIKEELNHVIITNFKRIASKLKQKPQKLAKFFSFDVGRETSYIGHLGMLRIRGFYMGDELEAILEHFINLYILCPECSFAGIELYKKSNGESFYNCRICNVEAAFPHENRFNSIMFRA